MNSSPSLSPIDSECIMDGVFLVPDAMVKKESGNKSDAKCIISNGLDSAVVIRYILLVSESICLGINSLQWTCFQFEGIGLFE
jgi:hypothetical protein